MTELGTFFEAMDALLSGREGACFVEARIGPSPSGTARLGFYAELVRRQRAQLLDALFPGVARAANAHRRGLWGALADGYTSAHPPRHWEPNAFGAHLADYLEALALREAAVPRYLAEIADLEYLEWLVTVAPRTSEVPLGDETMHVRRYEHDVVAYLEHAFVGCGPARPPREAPTTIVVCRTRTTDERFLLRVSAAALAAIARRAGEVVPAGAPPEAWIDAAERELVGWGVLAPE